MFETPTVDFVPASDLSNFTKYGYMVVKNAFSAETAALCRDIVWEHMAEHHNVVRHDMSTWPHKVSLDQVWMNEDGDAWRGVFTPKLANAIGSLVGSDRMGGYGAGWWMITFPGSSDAPWGADGSWHIDGHGYQHHLFSKQIGVICMMLFSDIKTSGGGTAIAEGSHIVACQVLQSAGLRGCVGSELGKAVINSGVDFDITELTGEAGDVILLHPFLLHARSKNLAPLLESGVRFLCHPAVPLKEHMDLQRPSRDLSVLENSIVRAILGDVGSEDSISVTVSEGESQRCRDAAVDCYSVSGAEREDEEAENVKDCYGRNVTAIEKNCDNSSNNNNNNNSNSSNNNNNNHSYKSSRYSQNNVRNESNVRNENNSSSSSRNDENDNSNVGYDVSASVGCNRRSRDKGTHPGHDDSASISDTTNASDTTYTSDPANVNVSYTSHQLTPVISDLDLQSIALHSGSIVSTERDDHNMNLRKTLSYLSVQECSEFARRKESRFEEMIDWEVGEEWGSFPAPTSTHIDAANPSPAICSAVANCSSKSGQKRKSACPDDGDEIDDIAAIMGFGSFKKSNNAS